MFRVFFCTPTAGRMNSVIGTVDRPEAGRYISLLQSVQTVPGVDQRPLEWVRGSVTVGLKQQGC
jgi:hypothetical protein